MVSGLRSRAARAAAGARMGAIAAAAFAACQVFAQAPAAPPAAAASRPAPPMPAPAASPVFTIKGFQVSGENPLSEADTRRVLAPYVGQATIDTLQKATAALEAELRVKGFGLHRVALPPQDVGDIVRLEIVKFTIGKVIIEGNQRYDDANVRRSLPELREGESPNFKKLAVQTAIANENPNKQLQVGLREAEEGDRIDAAIQVKENPPWSFGTSLSNAGTASSGHDRITFTGGYSNLFDRDQQFLAAYTTSFERKNDVKQLGLSYRAPIYVAGAVVTATYTKSDVVGNFGTFTSTGAGHTIGVASTWYLPPDGGRRSYITAGIDDKVFNATIVSGQVVGTPRRSRPITVGYSARTESDASTWGYNVDFATNTGTGSYNDVFDYSNEIAANRITRIKWKAIRGGFNYAAPFAQNWTWLVRGTYQITPDVLISGEQFGLGGITTVRGTRIDRPITGDRGLATTLEITTPELRAALRAIGFLDAGWLSNNNPDNATKRASDRLVSVGVGARYGGESFGLSLDYGRIVVGSRVPLTLNSASPQRGQDRVYVNFSWRF